MNKNWKRLNPPHSAVHFRARDFDYCVYLAYTGTPEALLAAGAIEPSILAGARTCGTGTDSFGNRYRRKLSGRTGRIEVARYVKSLETLPEFPGYEESWVPEPIRSVWCNPDKLHVSDSSDSFPGDRERIVGTKEALIAEGIASAPDFDFKGSWVELRNAPGYRNSLLYHHYRDYFLVLRDKLSSRPVFTPAERVKCAKGVLEIVESVSHLFSPETQSRVGAHIAAIMAEFDRELRRPERPHLRLVVDNAQRQGEGL